MFRIYSNPAVSIRGDDDGNSYGDQDYYLWVHQAI